MANVAKTFVNSNLRHNEYYNLQNTFDELYAKAQDKESFKDLMSIILSRENIELAYRNMKCNKGSKTPGTDGLSIGDIKNFSVDEVIQKINFEINSYQGYHPKPVKRVEIPKPNGKTRPLGIPSIWDRLIQQCIKQVMEPICEAKFNGHSYGFRPGRSVEQAIAEVYRIINRTHCYFVVEIDIKGFFDNVNHRKLLKQIWALGINDKQLLYIIGQILKAQVQMPDKTLITPNKGTPQGGILSPLLANIVLNELDWWIASQWENNPVINNYKLGTSKTGTLNKNSGYAAMRKTKLKEMHIVRYADDVRIFCRYKRDAEKVKHAVIQWLKDRLHLDTSEEKTKVLNAKRKYSEFLGFKIKVTQKRGKLVTRSHICDKKSESITNELCKQVKKIAKASNSQEALSLIRKFNSMVIGIHNYFQIATHINLDCQKIGYRINRVLENRLKRTTKYSNGRLSKSKSDGRVLTVYENDRYGKSKMIRFDKLSKSPIYPITYIKTRFPMNIRCGLTPYTAQGRQLMHKNLEIDIELLRELMQTKVHGTIEYADNRLSLFCAQYGTDAITGIPFITTEEIHCHHKIPRKYGGTDEYSNLILVSEDMHKLIHATEEEIIQKYLNNIKLNTKMLAKVNRLRKMAQLFPIKP